MNRREFLKLAGAIPIGYATSRLLRPLEAAFQGQPGNILIIVFDAFSAYNISLYGYERETTPNMTRLAKRAIRYHNHFAAGNFTTPGTASLLTGVLPWTHRALALNGRVADPFVAQTFFSAFKQHFRMAYSHNPFVATLLNQFAGEIDKLIPRESLYLESYDALVSTLFRNDDDISSISWIRNMQVNEEGFAYSLFLSHLYETLQDKRIENLKPLFPRGIPAIRQIHPFLLETGIDAVIDHALKVPRPFAGYFHFMPPHNPYRTTRDFFNAFKDDGYRSVEKPVDILANARRIVSPPSLSRQRTEYDEFILYCDREFGRLFNELESAGILDNTWLILTSDHGEMFERGIFGHDTNVLYQPVIRVPLLIVEPGRTQGLDIFEPTTAIDVVPTAAHLAGGQPTPWSEGRILPPFAPYPSNRPIFAVQAIDSDPRAPLTPVSVALVRENYKLHYYSDYKETSGEAIVKLFDIQSDPEELTDLALTKKGIANELLDELKTALAEADRPFAQ